MRGLLGDSVRSKAEETKNDIGAQGNADGQKDDESDEDAFGHISSRDERLPALAIGQGGRPPAPPQAVKGAGDAYAAEAFSSRRAG